MSGPMKKLIFCFFILFDFSLLFSEENDFESITNTSNEITKIGNNDCLKNIKDDLINEGVIFSHADLLFLSYDFVNLFKYKEIHFDKNTSTFYFLDGDFSRGAIFFMNGIAADEAKIRSHLEYLSQFVNDDELIGICDISTGWYDDIQLFSCGKAGIITAPVLSILIAWKNFFDHNNTAPLLHICHSQGAIYTKNALLRAPQKWRDRISIVNIAGAAYISEDLCKSAVNYVARLDLVPFLTSERWYFEMPDNLYVLDGGILDHHFQSASYNEVLKENISNYEKMKEITE